MQEKRIISLVKIAVEVGIVQPKLRTPSIFPHNEKKMESKYQSKYQARRQQTINHWVREKKKKPAATFYAQELEGA